MEKLNPMLEKKLDGSIVAQFDNAPGEDFSAVYAAEKWCADHGISVGRMQAHNPRGLLVGNFDIQKWRNLSKRQIAGLDGQMKGGRFGPAIIYLKPQTIGAILEKGETK